MNVFLVHADFYPLLSLRGTCDEAIQKNNTVNLNRNRYKRYD